MHPVQNWPSVVYHNSRSYNVKHSSSNLVLLLHYFRDNNSYSLSNVEFTSNLETHSSTWRKCKYFVTETVRNCQMAVQLRNGWWADTTTSVCTRPTDKSSPPSESRRERKWDSGERKFHVATTLWRKREWTRTSLPSVWISLSRVEVIKVVIVGAQVLVQVRPWISTIQVEVAISK